MLSVGKHNVIHEQLVDQGKMDPPRPLPPLRYI